MIRWREEAVNIQLAAAKSLCDAVIANATFRLVSVQMPGRRFRSVARKGWH